MLCDALHFGNKLPVPFVAPDPDPEQPFAPLHLEHDQLKMSGCLHHALAADMHPFDIRQQDLTLPVVGVENQSVVSDYELSIAQQVQQKRDERNNDKEHHDVDNRIREHDRELVLEETSLDSRIEQKYHQVEQCLLIVEVQFIFE